MGDHLEKHADVQEKAEQEPIPYLTDHAVFRSVTRFINGRARSETGAFLRAQWPTRCRVRNPKPKRPPTRHALIPM
jgi:hypothetical protein